MEDKERIAKIEELLKRFTRHELPEVDESHPDGVTLFCSHVDHEYYRRSVLLAKEFLAAK